MKNRCRKVFIIIAVIIFSVILLVLSPKITKAVSKNSTFSYVQNNRTELEETANRIISGETKTPYKYDNYTVHYFKSPLSAAEPIVEFNGYGFGLAPSGFYTGFYYSPKDIPVRFQGSSTAMEPYKKGWSYREKGDNNGYTEKICDNWYWFEFYF